ncbi:hypothetical protein FE634_21605 [Nocardioides dongxiaopingii]|nr:hypothetical protein [Nocardioides sp. S-1144]QDH10801.1 hypothetical protein FE634_21605 [Nocardioides sp. S-1144]
MSARSARPSRPARPARHPRPARPTRRWPAVLLALVCLLPVTACTGLPDSGPVVEAGTESQVNEREPDEVNAVPPAEDATPDEIVLGFLKAMTAWPTDTEVVEQYLSASAAGEWDPAAATITYVGQPLPREDNLRFTLTLNDAERIGRDGVWAGRLPPEEQQLALDLTIEDGQYRILDPPDALVVPRLVVRPALPRGLPVLLRPQRADPGPGADLRAPRGAADLDDHRAAPGRARSRAAAGDALLRAPRPAGRGVGPGLRRRRGDGPAGRGGRRPDPATRSSGCSPSSPGRCARTPRSTRCA